MNIILGILSTDTLQSIAQDYRAYGEINHAIEAVIQDREFTAQAARDAELQEARIDNNRFYGPILRAEQNNRKEFVAAYLEEFKHLVVAVIQDSPMQKINAIRKVRDGLGPTKLGLIEAKDIVDACWTEEIRFPSSDDELANKEEV